VGRMIPFQPLSELVLGYEGTRFGAGGGKETGSEYRWGAKLPTWSGGPADPQYVNTLAQQFFQYYEGGTDYWGWYKRMQSGVFGVGKQGTMSYPNLYRTGLKGYKQTIGVKSGGAISSVGKPLTEDDLTFLPTGPPATPGKKKKNPQWTKEEKAGAGKEKWGSSGRNWWEIYGRAGIGESEEAVKGLWASFFEAVQPGLAVERAAVGKLGLGAVGLDDRNRYKVRSATGNKMVSIAESAGEIDLAMILEEGGKNDAGAPWQMINANPNPEKQTRALQEKTLEGKGQDWITGHRKDLDFSHQFAESQIMLKALQTENEEGKAILGKEEIGEDFQGFEVSMYEVTNSTRILHFAKDAIKTIDDVKTALEFVEESLNQAIREYADVVENADLGEKELIDTMDTIVEGYEDVAAKDKKTLSADWEADTARHHLILTGQETQQILSRLIVGGLNQGYKTSSYIYEAQLDLDGQPYVLLIKIGTRDTNDDGIPDTIYTELIDNGAIKLEVGQRGIRNVVGGILFGEEWTYKKSAEFIQKAAAIYWMSNLTDASLRHIFQYQGHLIASDAVLAPAFSMATMTKKEISDSLITQFEAFIKNPDEQRARQFTEDVAGIVKSSSAAWLRATNWDNFSQAGGVPDNLFYQKDGYEHPPPPQEYDWVSWANMAQRGFYTPISAFDSAAAEGGSLSRVNWRGGAAGQFTANPARTGEIGKSLPLWVVPFFSATRKQMGKLSDKDIMQMG